MSGLGIDFTNNLAMFIRNTLLYEVLRDIKLLCILF